MWDDSLDRPRVLGERIRLWAALPEHAMRRQQLQAYLGKVSAVSAAFAIEELLVHTRLKNPDAITVYLALVDLLVLGDRLLAVRDEWRREAFKRGLAEVCYLLMEPALEFVVDEEDQPQLHPQLQELTLGEKKAFARVVQEKDIDKFANEVDPRVLEILFRHPALKSAWIVRMLAKRPQHPEVFLTLAQCSRWLALNEVQRTIVFNPYAPPGLAIKILPLLKLAEINEAAESPALATSVRAYAGRLRALQYYASEDLFEAAGAGERGDSGR